MKSKGTTEVGYVNRNQQRVLCKTDWHGTDYNQYVYNLKCQNCGKEYGANGSDIWQRKCPEPLSKCKYGGGRPGI